MSSRVTQMAFQDSHDELENALDKTTTELTLLQQQYQELEDKFNRFKYLETVISDNGIVDTEYHAIKDAVIDGSGKW